MVEFRKCNILHFPTNEQPRDHLVSDLHKKLSSTAFSRTAENFVELEEKLKFIQCQKGRLSALSPMEIFIVMLIKVLVVHFILI